MTKALDPFPRSAFVDPDNCKRAAESGAAGSHLWRVV